MTTIKFTHPRNSDEERRILAAVKSWAHLVPSWCDRLWLQIDDEMEAVATCSPVMHNGFATIAFNPTEVLDDEHLHETVVHELAHLYTFPDLRWLLDMLSGLDIDEKTCKVLEKGVMQIHETCNTALTTHFLKGGPTMKKSCGSKMPYKGGKMPYKGGKSTPPKKGK